MDDGSMAPTPLLPMLTRYGRQLGSNVRRRDHPLGGGSRRVDATTVMVGVDLCVRSPPCTSCFTIIVASMLTYTFARVVLLIVAYDYDCVTVMLTF